MIRGQLVSAVGRGDFSTKPRPCLIVQSDWFNDHHTSVVVCPITTVVLEKFFYRVPIPRDADNNLLVDSEIEIDLVQAIRRERIGRVIGQASAEIMFTVDQALRRWLAL